MSCSRPAPPRRRPAPRAAGRCPRRGPSRELDRHRRARERDGVRRAAQARAGVERDSEEHRDGECQREEGPCPGRGDGVRRGALEGRGDGHAGGGVARFASASGAAGRLCASGAVRGARRGYTRTRPQGRPAVVRRPDRRPTLPCRIPRRARVVIGAGPAGLTAAWELAEAGIRDVVVLEATRNVGGLSQSVEYKGNRIDIGGHRFFSKSDWVMDWWTRMLPLAAGGGGRRRRCARLPGQATNPSWRRGHGQGDRRAGDAGAQAAFAHLLRRQVLRLPVRSASKPRSSSACGAARGSA